MSLFTTFSECSFSCALKSLGDWGRDTLPLWNSNSFVNKEIRSDVSQAIGAQMLILTFPWLASPTLHSLALGLKHTDTQRSWARLLSRHESCTDNLFKLLTSHGNGRNPHIAYFPQTACFSIFSGSQNMIVLMQRMLPPGVEVGEMRGEPLSASALIFAANCCHSLVLTAEGAAVQLNIHAWPERMAVRISVWILLSDIQIWLR